MHTSHSLFAGTRTRDLALLCSTTSCTCKHWHCPTRCLLDCDIRQQLSRRAATQCSCRPYSSSSRNSELLGASSVQYAGCMSTSSVLCSCTGQAFHSSAAQLLPTSSSICTRTCAVCIPSLVKAFPGLLAALNRQNTHTHSTPDVGCRIKPSSSWTVYYNLLHDGSVPLQSLCIQLRCWCLRWLCAWL
jgi:hypothetical protein